MTPADQRMHCMLPDMRIKTKNPLLGGITYEVKEE